MKITIKIWAISMAVFGLTMTSCTKEGPEGPMGPIGPQGEQGLRGTQGEQGVSGEDGNANVIASAWIEPATEDVYVINNARSKSLVLNENMSYDHIHSATLLVYYDNDISVHALPYYNISSATGELSKSVTAEVNHASRTLYLKLNKFGSDLQPKEYLWDPDGPAYAKGVRFRYVIIPNNESGKTTIVNFEKMTYEEVMDYFGLDY